MIVKEKVVFVKKGKNVNDYDLIVVNSENKKILNFMLEMVDVESVFVKEIFVMYYSVKVVMLMFVCECLIVYILKVGYEELVVKL